MCTKYEIPNTDLQLNGIVWLNTWKVSAKYTKVTQDAHVLHLQPFREGGKAMSIES